MAPVGYTTSDDSTTNRTSSAPAARRSESLSTCWLASPSPVSPMTMNEKGYVPVRFDGATMKPLPSSVVRRDATTARTIAARQVSVRDAAHEFQMPAAQFSVSKYQLIPQMGTEATITAVRGNPI